MILTNEEQTEKIRKLYEQGFSVTSAANSAQASYGKVGKLFYEWDMQKAVKVASENIEKEFYIPESPKGGKRSNFVLCTTDTKVLDAYRAFTGKDYEP